MGGGRQHKRVFFRCTSVYWSRGGSNRAWTRRESGAWVDRKVSGEKPPRVFTSPRLFRELHEHGLYACGTVRQTRREFPADLRNVSLARGEGVFRQCNSLMAVVWQDKRSVHGLSMLPQQGETVQVSRRERDGSRVEVSCPSAILTYTKYMGGVDLGDQLCKYYCVRLKCT